MRRIVVFAAGVVLLIFGVGFANCIMRTDCTADPCFRQWVHCASTILTPNVQAALLTVGLGGLIAWWYQRANKIMEFRFETFKDMSTNMTDCCLQAALAREHAMYIEQATGPGGRGLELAGVGKASKDLRVQRKSSPRTVSRF